MTSPFSHGSARIQGGKLNFVVLITHHHTHILHTPPPLHPVDVDHNHNNQQRRRHDGGTDGRQDVTAPAHGDVKRVGRRSHNDDGDGHDSKSVFQTTRRGFPLVFFSLFRQRGGIPPSFLLVLKRRGGGFPSSSSLSFSFRSDEEGLPLPLFFLFVFKRRRGGFPSSSSSLCVLKRGGASPSSFSFRF